MRLSEDVIEARIVARGATAVPNRKSDREKRKRAARKRRAPAKVSGLPAYTPLIDELAEKVSRLRRQSCERARLDIKLHSSAEDKREVFKGALCSWTDDTYALVLDGLRNHLQYAIAEIGQSAPLTAYRWAEEQVSLALARGLGHTTLPKNQEHRKKHEASLRSRLSGLGAVTKQSAKRNKQDSEDLIADDGALEWLREYSTEWVKLACDDPTDRIWVLMEWRAPAWAVGSDSVGDRATAEETENLLNDAAGKLRSSLENARFDAFEPLPGQKKRKPPRKITKPLRQAIERLWRQYPGAQYKDIAFYADQNKVPTFAGWRLPPGEDTWTKATINPRFADKVKKFIFDCRPSHR